MMPIRKIYVENFRGMHNQTADFQGKRLNAIVGQNSSMKTTLLGMLATPFSIRKTNMKEERAIDGGQFQTKINDKFRFSDGYDEAGSHRFTITVNQAIYHEKDFSVVSIRRSLPKGGTSIRFWSSKGRSEEDSFMPCPVLFLSLKRLIPIPELGIIKLDNITLSEEETQLYCNWHNRVLICLDNIESPNLIRSSEKNTLAPKTDYYDPQAISAGQDNLGRLILAILSMKRLKENYPSDYKGSVICIDELESTFYPASQIKLLELLKDVSELYSIQFFFTTHSMTIVDRLFSSDLKTCCSIAYTRKIGKDVKIIMNPTLNEIRSDLYLSDCNSGEIGKIHVYCEDTVGVEFTKILLGRKYTNNQIKYQERGCNLGYPNYKYLLEHNVAEFIHSVIVLDGDVRNKKEYASLKKYKNVVFLPTDSFPELIVYDCLRSLDEEDSFWEHTLTGYTKQRCFKDYITEGLTDEDIKKWYKDQKGRYGRGHTKMIKKSMEYHKDDIERFEKEFDKAYEYVLTHSI